ncbi:TIGR04084 family radical SAM/SPASM domain-containing protein [Candidatus Woesearchaeota archaeon]|nr:TIGR04084 family radical SAM/SPASM domain-containing protein [Candidatus Woesearchaeota archaeon]
MFYHLITSVSCNLSCSYCDRDEFGPPEPEVYDYTLPKSIQYPLEKLKQFIQPEDYITFYGGEPLLGISSIKQIMDQVSCKGFMIQTNGILLHQLGSEYLQRFHTILVSIDGDEEATDKNRGRGVHAKVMKNISLLQERGFKGELIARMTITKGSSLLKQALWLLNNGFSSIHWQLDVMFYKEEDTSWLPGYNTEISRLVAYWIRQMKNGKVLRLYPFLAIMDSILKKEEASLRCGAGHANYTILTHGKIVPCPIMQGMKEYYCGELPSRELKSYSADQECKKCSILGLCGGRCLYAHAMDLWSREGREMVCGTILHLITALKEKEDEVRELILKKVIKEEDFSHLRYNGVEVIP